MKRCRHLPRAGGFTLTEIVLALAVIATAFVAILGLLPAGLDASRQAANATIVATIFGDLHQRAQHQPLKAGPLPFSPAYFDDRGIFIPDDAPPEEKARRLYRADVKITEWLKQPESTSALRPISIELSWPVNPETGEPLGSGNPKTVVSYAATTLAGPDWELTYPPARPDLKYQPRIEF